MLTGSVNATKEYYQGMTEDASTYIEPANVELPSGINLY